MKWPPIDVTQATAELADDCAPSALDPRPITCIGIMGTPARLTKRSLWGLHSEV